MAMISNDWLPALKDEFRKPYYAKLFSFVKEEYATHVVYPPADDIFNPFFDALYIAFSDNFQRISFYTASRGEGRDFGTGPLS